MIAFGCAIVGAEAYRRYAEPGIELAAEEDSEVLAFVAVEPVSRSCNLILEAAARYEDLEALVLVHPHTELRQRDFCARVRDALADDEVGAVGCLGARGVTSIAWWEGEVVRGSVRQHYPEHGGGEVPAVFWANALPPSSHVEVLDGQLLILSPWTVRNVRFDETLVLNHGFDLDFSLQLHKAGRKLLVADLDVVHHRSIELVNDVAVWTEAHIQLAEKWGAELVGEPPDELAWKRRARLAEARKEAARAIAMSQSLKRDARVLEMERQLEAITSTRSWQLTAPLRALNHRRRQASAGTRGHGDSRQPKPWD